MNNPYRIETPFIVSFSGGATSGFMLRKILDAYGGELPDDARVVFCNTGLEHSKTLDFVHEIESRWCAVDWVEYCPENRFKVVNYESASREGEPFSALLEARGYPPTPVARICTTNLKIRASASYLKCLGWSEWDNAIGLRADEPHRVHRMKPDCKAETPVMPMYHAGHTLHDVDEWWSDQPFKLEIPRWMGNCCGCYLKSRGRLEMVASEDPKHLEWWAREEEKLGKPFRIDRPGYRSIQLQVINQGRLFEDDGSTMPCTCTE